MQLDPLPEEPLSGKQPSERQLPEKQLASGAETKPEGFTGEIRDKYDKSTAQQKLQHQALDDVLKRLEIGFGDVVEGEWHLGKVKGNKGDGVLIVKKMQFVDVSFNGEHPRPVFEIMDLYFMPSNSTMGHIVWRSSDYSCLEEAKKQKGRKLRRFLRKIEAPQEDIKNGWASIQKNRRFNLSMGQYRLFRQRKIHPERRNAFPFLASHDQPNTRQMTALNRQDPPNTNGQRPNTNPQAGKEGTNKT